MKTITRTNFLKLTGLPEPLCDHWYRRGIAKPPYTLSRTVGVALAHWLRRHDIGMTHAANVAKCISDVSEEYLADKIKRGYVLLVLELVSGKLFWARTTSVFRRHERGEAQFCVIDMQAAFERVKPRFDEIAKDDSTDRDSTQGKDIPLAT